MYSTKEAVYISSKKRCKTFSSSHRNTGILTLLVHHTWIVRSEQNPACDESATRKKLNKFFTSKQKNEESRGQFTAHWISSVCNLWATFYTKSGITGLKHFFWSLLCHSFHVYSLVHLLCKCTISPLAIPFEQCNQIMVGLLWTSYSNCHFLSSTESFSRLLKGDSHQGVPCKNLPCLSLVESPLKYLSQW